jgi:hypothetical protein
MEIQAFILREQAETAICAKKKQSPRLKVTSFV